MRIENINQMLERHKREIAQLQHLCKHRDVSDWQPFMWAPGHFGESIRVCKFCGKVVEQDTENKHPWKALISDEKVTS